MNFSLCSTTELGEAQCENLRILSRQNEVPETQCSLFPIHRRLPKLGIQSAYQDSDRIGNDKRTSILEPAAARKQTTVPVPMPTSREISRPWQERIDFEVSALRTGPASHQTKCRPKP